MCVCMDSSIYPSIHLYVCMHVCMYLSIYLSINLCMYMYMYVYIYTSPYIYIYLSMYVYYIIVAHFGDAATQIARPGVQRGRGHSTLGSRELSAWAGA